jgi:ribosome-binding protein aMBF1 (putative translation factor)
MKYPDYIRQARQQLGMTPKELADSLSVSSSSVRRWENCNAKPNYFTLIKLYLFFKSNIGDASLNGEVD